MKTITIPLVKGDGRPLIKFRIDDANVDAPIADLANNTVTAHMLFRELGAETSIADIELSKVGDGAAALVLLDFDKGNGASWLDDVEAGVVYEGQIYLLFNNVRQTVQTKIRFVIKEAFPDA